MDQGFAGEILSSADAKKKMTPTYELDLRYGDNPVYYTLVHIVKMVVGGMWMTIWIALILSLTRYVRAYFRIGWTRADENQMMDYYNTKIVAQIFVFTLLWIALSFTFAMFPFGRDAIQYGFISGGIYVVIQILNYLKAKILKPKAPKPGKTKTE